MDESEALDQFAGDDEQAARRAFGWLCEHSRPFLHAYLKPSLASAEAREDIIQSVVAGIWTLRSRFHNRGPGAWYALLARTAGWRLRDTFGDPPPVPLDDETLYSLADPGCAVTEEVIRHLSEQQLRERVYHHANRLWLGLDPALTTDTHRRQLLAAQLYYLDGELWDSICQLSGAEAVGEPTLTRALLDQWLEDPGVLRHLSFDALYYSNDRLAVHLLGLPEPVDPAALDALMRQALSSPPTANSPLDWTWAEVAVILWRYRNALLLREIVGRKDCALNPEQIDALLVRLRSRLPFTSIAAQLLERLEQAPGGIARSALGQPGLWQRLAFQYWIRDDLPIRDIYERTQPAAAQVGYEIKLENLNMWLSGGRLLKQLVKVCARVGEEDAHE